MSIYSIHCSFIEGQILCPSQCAHLMFCSCPRFYYLNEYDINMNCALCISHFISDNFLVTGGAEYWLDTTFRRINALGTVAENEALSMSDFDETLELDPRIP